MRRAAVAVSSLVLALPLFVACSSSSTPAAAPAAPQGPLSGTYSADSTDGTSPFAAITFLDNAHYSYIAASCNDPKTASTLQEDDPGDPEADSESTTGEDDSATCVHAGTYKLTQTDLYLTDDGATSSVDVPLSELPLNGTEVTDPAAEDAGAPGTSLTTKSVHTDDLTITFGGSSSDAGVTDGGSVEQTLIAFIQYLFGLASVSAFNAAGTPMRRTGLVLTINIGSGGAGVSLTPGSSPSGSSSSGSAAGSSAGSSGSSAGSSAGSSGSAAGSSSGTSSASPSGANADGGLVASSAVAAALQWVNVKMPYCQAANHGHEVDSACVRTHGSTCTRTGAADQPQWNAYRSDCSGLVSWAWSLKAPGLTTGAFMPGAAVYVPAQDLQPGDALLNAGHHIVLFESWINKSSGQAKVIAEPGCSAKGGPYAQEQTWSLGHAPGASPGGSWNGTTYQAIRKKGSTLVSGT